MTGSEDVDDAIPPGKVARAIFQWLKGVAQVLAGIIGAGFAVWQLIGDDITEIARAPEEIKQQRVVIERVERELLSLTGTRPPPTVEFRDAFVYPNEVLAGELYNAVLNMRRNEDCVTFVERRYYDLERGIYDPQVNDTIEAVRAPVTRNFALFKIVYRVPKELRPGMWAYHPIIRPSERCENTEPVVAPMMWFRVVAATEDARR